jgi:Transposase IS66 family/IS66 C-terminal element
MLPPRPTRRRLQRFHDFEAATGLQYPLSTLHERRCRRPCKTRFRLAGSASTGRVSNPLGRNERFLVTSFLLPRTYPDASWAHARRKFYEVHQATASPIAAEALRRIAELYAIETTIRGQTAVIRQSVRQARSLPLVGAMKLWLEAQLAHIPPRSSLADAVRYALNRWEALCRFLDDGRIELDTNTVERAIRPVTLGRKNHLFAGSDRGADRWATVCSLITTAKLNDVEPFAYLEDVLERMSNGHPMSRLDDLLPWKP